MGEELIRENDIEIRLKEYIVQLLNGDEVSDRGGWLSTVKFNLGK